VSVKRAAQFEKYKPQYRSPSLYPRSRIFRKM
jgi:hypothetical protein